MNLLHIDEMYAFIASDETGEGIIGFRGPEGWVPLVGADMARVDSLRHMAQRIATSQKIAIKLVKFTTRTEIETINP
jgi:hypothetical protein